MLFDVNLLFWHTGNVFNFTSGEFVTLAGTASSCASSVINLGVPEDMGIGDGEFIPHIAVSVGSAITSTCQSLRINMQFQGSTDSVTWTTYIESGAQATASYGANSAVLPQSVPRRPAGVALPQYYRLNMAVTGNGSSETITTGSLIGGIVIQRADSAGTLDQYPAGFTVS